MSELLPEALRPPFARTWKDRLFALLFYAVGYCYLEVAWRDGVWLTLFAALYAAAVLGYFCAAGVRIARWSWFWLAVLLGIALGRGLWPNRSLLGIDLAVLHLVALYWPLSAAGATLRPCTSPLLPVDALNAGVIVPFGNIAAQFRCLFGGWRRREGGGRQALAALVGAAALLLALALVVPLLMEADAAFAQVLRALGSVQLRWDPALLLAVPVGAYLFGLGYGAAHRRHTGHIRAERLRELGEDVRVAPNVTLAIFLGGVCLVYALFLLVQAGSLFGVFSGRLDAGESCSAAAREGFFQLCRVASINGVLLLAANLLAGKPRGENPLLRAGNVVLSALTLLILASAAGKMLRYVQEMGVTPKRVLTLAFMAMLAVLFGGTVVWQWRKFNLIRLAVCFAAGLFLALCLCGLDRWLVAYNSARGIVSAFF